jgi:Calcineurin-like phosphoesterase
MRNVLALALAVVAALVLAVGASGSGGSVSHRDSGESLTIAVIGDTPYGPAQLAQFPELVADINDERGVDLALHLGDIKDGSSLCTDAYFGSIESLFDTFDDPLVYTPGDNEWTDCHRANNGGYQPLERLDALREVFFDRPGRTLGGRGKHVSAQRGFPENQLWEQSDVVFSTVHVVGSNNDLVPWFGAPSPSPEQLEEYESRLEADLRWLDRTFRSAERSDARGVVLAMQADMWNGTIPRGSGFVPVIDRITELAEDFERPVLILQGTRTTSTSTTRSRLRRTSRGSSSKARPRASGSSSRSSLARGTSSPGSASA